MSMRKYLRDVLALLGGLSLLLVATNGWQAEAHPLSARHSTLSSRPASPSLSTHNDDVLYSLSAVNKNDIWAAGYQGSYANSDSYHSRLAHWNGKQWQTVAGVELETGSVFHAITALSRDNVYAAGEAAEGPYIAQWDGKHWQTAYGVTDSSSTTILYALAAVNKNDIWAAGNGVLLHWDGKQWRRSKNRGVTLNGLAAISKDDIWGVGEDQTRSAVLQHWDGHTWSRVSSPVTGKYTSLESVTALSKNDVWAVGQDRTQTLILHWNGQEWQQSSSPNPSANYNRLTSISALSATNIWAVGHMLLDSCLYYCGQQTLIEHWNGKSWRRVESPSLITQDTELQAVIALSPQEAWAVGSTFAGYDYTYSGQTVAEHWNGKRWEMIPTPAGGQ